MGHVTLTIMGEFVIPRLIFDMVYLRIEFEDPIFSHFTDIKEDHERIKIGIIWDGYGHSRSSAMLQFDRAHTTSYSSLVESMRLSCTIFEI